LTPWSQRMNRPKADYLTKQVIAYIGNKRRLLHLIHRALQLCLGGDFKGKTFLDLFAGSGIVSRLAKFLGFRVCCNDWEYFSYIINTVYIGINRRELAGLFSAAGGIEEILKVCNTLPAPPAEDRYISRYYCPPADGPQKVDYNTHRMFYTQANGLVIDGIRTEIERLYPGHAEGGGGPERESTRQKEKHLLLALLLYESATHTNTSGVFKAYHKGFGGHSGDALKRIMAPIALHNPVLIDSPYSHKIYMQDANRLVRSPELGRTEFDIAYLDPPYNQHQYGSNYHLLNTIARWDKPPVNMTKVKNGKLVDKGGIRKDWIKTRSPYCYKQQAAGAFRDLLSALQARYILLSYSTEGIIPFDDLYGLCAEKGRVDLVTNEYTKYRGGRQSLERLNNNIELILIIDTQKKQARHTAARVRELLLRKDLRLQCKKPYRKACLRREFALDEAGQRIVFKNNGDAYVIPSKGFFRLQYPPALHEVPASVLSVLIAKLRACQCVDREEELDELFRIIASADGDKSYFIKLLPHTLRKIAHKKYKKLYVKWAARIRNLEKTEPALYEIIRGSIKEVEVIAEKRFSG